MAETNQRKGAGFWTVAEHMSHLAQVQPMLLECLQRFLVKDRPEFVPDIPDDTEEKDRDPQMEMKAALAEHRSVGNSNSPCSKTPMMPPGKMPRFIRNTTYTLFTSSPDTFSCTTTGTCIAWSNSG